MCRINCCVAFLLLFAAIIEAGELRVWTDQTGRHRTEAELQSADRSHATLKKRDGSVVRVPIEKLSKTDQEFISNVMENVHNETPGSGIQSDSANDLSTYSELKRLIQKQRNAQQALALLNAFIATEGISDSEKALARADLPEWQVKANSDALRVGRFWVTPSEHQQMKDDEIRLIKEAHRLIDIKSDQVARDKFREASKINQDGVRADFYLGLLNTLVVPTPGEAEEHFRECVRRLAMDGNQLSGVRKANYVAALNNYAVVLVRMRKYNEAIGVWDRALAIAPYTPELVQNLGLLAKLSETAAYVRVPRGLRASAASIYAKVSVENSLGRFDDNVGWLLIPYVDTLDGSIDESGDEEFVTYAWCTGFSIGGDYVVTSRYPLLDSDKIVVREGANVFEVPAGKVVALSDQSSLALLRIDGLGAAPIPLSPVPARPTQDVIVTGYREPGFSGDTFQRRPATIVDLPNILRHVDTSTFRAASGIKVHWFNHRDMIMHDAITSAGMEGAPLLDNNGIVVGVHLGNRPEFGTTGEKFSFAEPSHLAIRFLQPIFSGITVDESTTSVTKALEPQAQRKLAESSIFQLAVQKRAPRLAWTHRIEALHQAQRQGNWVSYEDKTCMACNGRLTHDCTNRGCSRGSVRRRERELKYTDPNTGNQIWGTRIIVEKCPVCSGNGRVRCSHCNGSGQDGMFR